jgi:CxxC motif-containing protein (DUF1111 family)
MILSAFAGTPRSGTGVFQGELEDLHPGFKGRTSVVLHRHAAGREDEQRLMSIRAYSTVQTRDELIALATSQRNTPALFGAGQIDGISDQALLAAETRTFTDFPEIKGRVSRLKDGRLGRFGWKGQIASLQEFVLAACSNELGLEVPGHHQASFAASKTLDPSTVKLDLDENECSLLFRFVANLPRPVFVPVKDAFLAVRGRAAFSELGCATCHSPSLGHIDGLFSDLLLHDLGNRFREFGSGYGSASSTARVVDRTDKPHTATPPGEAGPTEWRTAPLWGVADSAPYLHDGRANTLDEAIRLHGGEAAKTSQRYSELTADDRQCLLAFLHSLRAPKPRLSRSASPAKGHKENTR